MQDPEVAIADLFVDLYSQLRVAWRQALTTEECDDDAPAQLWRTDDQSEHEQILVQAGELSATTAGTTVQHHFALLSRAYWPNPYDVDAAEIDRYPGQGIYPLARAILEALTLVCYLQNGSIDIRERVIRSSEFLLWANARKWDRRIRAANVEIRRMELTSAPYVYRDESSRPASWAKLTKATFGRIGQSAYARWSAMSHHNPHAVAKVTNLRMAHEGVAVSSALREDKHLEVLFQITKFVSIAGRNQAVYFGRSDEMLQSICSNIENFVHLELPNVRQAVESRNIGSRLSADD
jgi:hypothetical protein